MEKLLTVKKTINSWRNTSFYKCNTPQCKKFLKIFKAYHPNLLNEVINDDNEINELIENMDKFMSVGLIFCRTHGKADDWGWLEWHFGSELNNLQSCILNEEDFLRCLRDFVYYWPKLLNEHSNLESLSKQQKQELIKLTSKVQKNFFELQQAKMKSSSQIKNLKKYTDKLEKIEHTERQIEEFEREAMWKYMESNDYIMTQKLYQEIMEKEYELTLGGTN